MKDLFVLRRRLMLVRQWRLMLVRQWRLMVTLLTALALSMEKIQTDTTARAERRETKKDKLVA